MPRQWKGRTLYSKAELEAMTSAERERVTEAHQAKAFVREDELPPEFVRETTTLLVERIAEREARDHRQAS